jgi:3-dehydro-L-gulonate 2-dehydrogenase
MISRMNNTLENIFISQDQMKAEFLRILLNNGFSLPKAEICAELFTVNSLDGVYSHGVNRFTGFVKNIKEGYIRPEADPLLLNRAGSLEQWDGMNGPGPLNALFVTDRAMELARENGIGMVALANTNHWMRGGTYGWKAAREGFVFIGWTNTTANMPAWGAKDFRQGNNPLVIALPYGNEAIVLDFAMSQFSYGKMESYQREGKELPYPGGFDNKGKLTSDPDDIMASQRALPIGYWKGAGLSLLLDIMATILSGGLSTHEISKDKVEHSVSQVFIAINLKSLKNFPAIENSVRQIIEDLQKSEMETETAKIRYPGENVVKIRNENIQNGIPVNRSIWQQILSL